MRPLRYERVKTGPNRKGSTHMQRPWMMFFILAAAMSLPLSAQQVEDLDDEPDVAGQARHDHTHEDEGEHELRFYDAVDVSERAEDLLGIAGSANQGTTGREDLAKRPKLRTGDLVETVPGAIATQHSGGGKANQYFLRGFNLDHGTDFSVSVAGMPVNMPTHGHGQGYADLNFLIPELVERAHYRKGPYFAEVGDFSSAGGVGFDLVRALPEGTVQLAVGSFDYQRALAAGTLTVGDGDLTGAVEYYHNDGPWERPDDYRRFNGYLGYSRGDTFRGWSLNAMGSDGEWLATDKIPRRAVEEGLVDRWIYGLNVSHRWNGHLGEAHTENAVGLSLRYDDISKGLYRTTDPVRTSTTRQDDIGQLGHWSGALRLRYFSGGPLIEDDSVTWGPTVLLNGTVGYRFTRRFSVFLKGYNLLDREDDDIAYYYASRLQGEPVEGVEDIHFHPMEKPSARLVIQWMF